MNNAPTTKTNNPNKGTQTMTTNNNTTDNNTTTAPTCPHCGTATYTEFSIARWEIGKAYPATCTACIAKAEAEGDAGNSRVFGPIPSIKMSKAIAEEKAIEEILSGVDAKRASTNNPTAGLTADERAETEAMAYGMYSADAPDDDDIPPSMEPRPALAPVQGCENAPRPGSDRALELKYDKLAKELEATVDADDRWEIVFEMNDIVADLDASHTCF